MVGNEYRLGRNTREENIVNMMITVQLYFIALIILCLKSNDSQYSAEAGNQCNMIISLSKITSHCQSDDPSLTI